MLTKGINIGILLLAFSWFIRKIIAGQTDRIVEGATAGLSTGSFSKDTAMKVYGPMLAAIVLKKAISMVRRQARV